ncbi:HpcH/HpaI aldolase family protein [Anaerolentibacter hominis]|uniref:HpcH/HpaI aldolase family protein n=1 Tax=Anaerolentibacter hominis TaxID=3079009 RepID=UPI0031B87587
MGLRKNLVREQWKAGRKTVGTFLNLGSAIGAEAIGVAGFDYFIVDTEHGPYDVEAALSCVRSAEIRGLTPFVRIREISRPAVLKAFDIGAQGIIIPFVKTAEEARKLVEYGKYKPVGQRGFCPTRCSDFGFNGIFDRGMESYMMDKNDEVMIIPQCETKECFDSLEEIVSLEGIDGIFVGPYDLSIALGKPGQFDDPEIAGAIAHIREVCEKNGKFVMIYAPTVEAAKSRLAEGFDSVTYNTDINILIGACKEALEEIRK